MALTDHLNLTGLSPLLGTNPDQLGPRFPDMTDAWDSDLRARMHEAAGLEGIRLEEGVYAGILGPNYETPAEVRMLRSLGADAVGMSTVLEAIAARWAGLRLAGVSLVTNPGAGVTGQPLSHEEVLQAADEAAPRFERLVSRFVSLLPD
jgi:purine-nucleoside phosphorylase